MARTTTQAALNTLAATSGKSPQECLNILAGETSGTRYTKRQAWNIYAGTVGMTSQDAANFKAGTKGLSIQDCVHVIAGITL